MGTENVNCQDNEDADKIIDCAVEDDMVEKLRAFRELSESMRRWTAGTPQTPSEILIREDRDSGHRDG